MRAGWKLLGLGVGVAAAAGVGIVLGRSTTSASNGRNALGTSEAVANVNGGTSPSAAPAASWSLDHLTDRMTDDQIIRARRIFSGRAFMVRTDVECVGGRRLRYRFEVRRADRRLSSLRWQIGSAPVLIRADDGPVYSFVPNLNATNIVELFAPDVPDAVDGFRNDYRVLARGRLGLMTESRNAAILLAISSRVRVTIHMITGDAFVEFDQGVGPVQSIIRACGIDADAVRQSVAALANRAEPPQQADSTQPYESENTPPEDSAGSEEGAPGDPEESRPDKRDRV